VTKQGPSTRAGRMASSMAFLADGATGMGSGGKSPSTAQVATSKSVGRMKSAIGSGPTVLERGVAVPITALVSGGDVELWSSGSDCIGCRIRCVHEPGAVRPGACRCRSRYSRAKVLRPSPCQVRRVIPLGQEEIHKPMDVVGATETDLSERKLVKRSNLRQRWRLVCHGSPLSHRHVPTGRLPFGWTRRAYRSAVDVGGAPNRL